MARALVNRYGIPLLEFDTIVWEPGKVAVLRARGDIVTDVERFLNSNEEWVVEGCYGELVEVALPCCTEVIFLNPGLEACVANNRRRPWKPHKYESAEAQNAMLTNLLDGLRATTLGAISGRSCTIVESSPHTRARSPRSQSSWHNNDAELAIAPDAAQHEFSFL